MRSDKNWKNKSSGIKPLTGIIENPVSFAKILLSSENLGISLLQIASLFIPSIISSAARFCNISACLLNNIFQVLWSSRVKFSHFSWVTIWCSIDKEDIIFLQIIFLKVKVKI